MSVIEHGSEASPSSDDCKWRVLRAKPKGEHLAAQHLRREGFEAFCPRLRHQKKTTRGRVWFVEAMFPGYIFCRFSMRESLRHVVSTAFVSQALTFMHDAGSVSDAVVGDLRRQFDDKETITIESTVQPGDSVDIVDGPMSGSQAVVTQVLPGKERVRILLEFIGGLQEVEVPLLSLITGRDPPLSGSPPRQLTPGPSFIACAAFHGACVLSFSSPKSHGFARFPGQSTKGGSMPGRRQLSSPHREPFLGTHSRRFHAAH